MFNFERVPSTLKLIISSPQALYASVKFTKIYNKLFATLTVSYNLINGINCCHQRCTLTFALYMQYAYKYINSHTQKKK